MVGEKTVREVILKIDFMMMVEDMAVVKAMEKAMEGGEKEAGKCPVIETTLHFSFVEIFHCTG